MQLLEALFVNCKKLLLEYFQYWLFFLATFNVFKIAHSSLSSISLFFLKNILLSFYLAIFLFFKQRAGKAWSYPSFVPFIHKTKLVVSFLASLNPFFLHLIIRSALNNKLNPIFLTSFVLLSGWIKWSTICYSHHCPYNAGHEFCVCLRLFFGNSPCWKSPSLFLWLIGRIFLIECKLRGLNN